MFSLFEVFLGWYLDVEQKLYCPSYFAHSYCYMKFEGIFFFSREKKTNNEPTQMLCLLVKKNKYENLY